MRKKYLITTEVRRYTIELDEQEREEIRRHYHGFVRIEPVVELDFDAIARELDKER